MSSLENIDLLQTRILICGLGSIGNRHARVFNQLSPDIQLSAHDRVIAANVLSQN